jgi:hypothetical protein
MNNFSNYSRQESAIDAFMAHDDRAEGPAFRSIVVSRGYAIWGWPRQTFMCCLLLAACPVGSVRGRQAAVGLARCSDVAEHSVPS